jgi:CHAT domain-containing protein
LDDLHKPEEALETALRAERIADRSGSWLVRYWVRRLLGSLYFNRGDYESGLRALREARSISDSAHDPISSAWAASALAAELIDIGDWEEARDQANFALPIFREASDVGDEFNMYWQLTDIYGARESELKDFDKALEYYRLAYQMLGKNDPREPGLGLTLEEIYWQQGRFKEAIAKASEALSYYEQTKDELGQASALITLAEAQRSNGDVQAGAVSLARAEPLIQRAQNFYTTGRFHYGLANQRKKEGRFKDAIAEYERVIELLEQFKSTTDLSLRRKASETYSFVYDELIDAYYFLGSHDQQGSPFAADKALQYAELNKARAFTDSWGRAFIEGLRRQVPPPLQDKERELSAREEALQSELVQSMSGQGQRSVNRVRDDLHVLAKERSVLETDLRQANPAYAEARYPQPIAISDLPLHPGETLIEFKVLPDGLMVWVIQATESAPRLAAFYKVEHSRDWFSERILSIRSAFNRAQPDMFDPQVSEELFDAIFPAPLAHFLTDAKSILFIPDDILCLLPFEMLSAKASQKQFALLQTPTSYFPSAAALRLSRKALARGREWQTQFFGVADPITSADDERYAAASVVANLAPVKEAAQPVTQGAVRGTWSEDKLKTRGYFFDRLPETGTEVRTIASLFPSSPATAVVRTGMEATKRDLLQTDLIRFRFIHFATHGFLPVGGATGEPALVLSYGGKDEKQMMLTLTEVLGMKLHADMVVLSACNTGTGRVTRAEGVASLGMAFLAAGASSATVSLWKVSDKSTAVLMQEFYRNLLNGMPKNAALAAARSALVTRGYANPFFWAPFVLTGE